MRRALLLLPLWLTGCGTPTPAPVTTTASDENHQIVQLVIDYGDGVQKHFVEIPWREEMTVLDALQYASEHSRGIELQSRGSGATAFLTQIDDLQNEGTGRNWVYRVNGQHADRSCAVQTVKPADTILWEFGAYR